MSTIRASEPNLSAIVDVGITAHAIERLRERLPAGSGVQSLSDHNLRKLLMKAWSFAREEGKIELWWESVPGKRHPVLNYVVPLDDVLESAKLVGLVREDNIHRGKPCFITVITEDMAQRNRGSNRWARSSEQVDAPGLLNDALQQQLRDVVVADEQKDIRIKEDLTPGDPPRVVLTWKDPVDGHTHFALVLRSKAEDAVQALVEADARVLGTIGLWAPLPHHLTQVVKLIF